jgi:hypothetical protein
MTSTAKPPRAATALRRGVCFARTLGLTLACSVGLAAMASAAQAAGIGFEPKIQGAGKVVAIDDTGFYTCDKWNQQDDRKTETCGRSWIGNDLPTTVVYTLRVKATAAATPSGHWKFVNWTNCPKVIDGNVCEMSSPWYGSSEEKPVAHFDDSVAPPITLGTEWFDPSADRTVQIPWSTGESATTECSRDSGAYEICASPKRYELDAGEHTFQVRATDASGNVGVSERRSFTILDTVLTSAPPDLIATRSARFAFEGRGGASEFLCSVDGATFSSCRSPMDVTVGSDGLHSFSVKAKDGRWEDAVPARRLWRVDTQPPETFLNPAFGPRDGAQHSSSSETFHFGSSEPGSLQCRMDGAPFQACVSPHTVSSLTPGAHTFEVRAIDEAGNIDPTPEHRAWTAIAADRDLDGYLEGSDCNDGNSAINPGRPDIPDNGIDENCDGRDSVNLDRDGDGYDRDEPGGKAPFDCDDVRADRNPGATDKPQNGLDENCDGVDAPLPSITSEVRYAAKSKRGRVIIRKLAVIRPPDGAKVELRCKNKRKGCKFSRRREVAAPGTSQISFASDLRKTRLRRGAVLEVWITRSDMRGKVVRLTVRRGGKVTGVTLCVAPGSKTPTGCPPA